MTDLQKFVRVLVKIASFKSSALAVDYRCKGHPLWLSLALFFFAGGSQWLLSHWLS